VEAIKALETSDYGLVLMDTLMPEMDGLEAAGIIRDVHSNVLNHQIPIIAMTACALESNREKCAQAGMNEFLSKPIEMAALTAALEKWLPAAGHPPLSQVHQEMGAPDREPANLPIFNRATLMDRLMEDEDIAHQILLTFLTDLPGQIKNLQLEVAKADLKKIQEQAHKIKGAAANLSGEALAALAHSIEQAARQNDLDSVRFLAVKLENQLEFLTAALTNEAAAPGSQNQSSLPAAATK
jgi:HPt (histidine-containing phosphotransfer) domain-containing protein